MKSLNCETDPHLFVKILTLAGMLVTTTYATEKTRIIQADTQKLKGSLTHMPQRCVGSGYAPLGLRADWQEQLKIVREECGFDHIRFHAIFHDDMGIFDTDLPFETIAPQYLSPSKESHVEGLKAEYFDNSSLLKNPTVVTTNPCVNFCWTQKSPIEGIASTNFSVRWTGTLTAPVEGIYRIGVAGDDGVRLFIDGKLVAENWLVHPKTFCGVDYAFKKGQKYDIRVEYFQGKGHAEVALLWCVPWKGPISFYNWQYIDKLYDFLLSQGVKPFVELSFMPTALASNQPGADGRTTVFWYKGNITPPKNYAKWEQLVHAFVEHLTKRYGAKEVEDWYFEVWNEPNIPPFWASDQKEYFKLYQTTARAVKAVNSNYRVGGPATAGNGWVKEILAFCETNRVPINFISTHCYGVNRGFLDESGHLELCMSTNRNGLSSQVRQVRQSINATKYTGLELHYTEWSTSYSLRDPVHDSYYSAPYILHTLKGVDEATQSMSYWTFSDIFEEGGPPPTPFHGGFGLINLQGLRKPSFYAYKYFNALGDTELECDDPDAWITKDGDNIQVLFWNFTVAQQDAPNKVYFKRDLPSARAGKTILKLSNLRKGSYEMKVFKVGYRVNDVYTDFLDMGSPESPTPQQIQKLARMNDGSPVEIHTIKIKKDGNFTKSFDLRENDVLLITLTRK